MLPLLIPVNRWMKRSCAILSSTILKSNSVLKSLSTASLLLHARAMLISFAWLNAVIAAMK